MKRHAAALISVAVLVLMATLMAAPIREESATVDETAFLAAGYSYWHGYGFTIDPEAPPLAKMISTAPLLFMDVKLPGAVQESVDRPTRPVVTRRWSGEPQFIDERLLAARDNWYLWPNLNAQYAGQEFVYGGVNDADRILAAGRWMQVALTVLTGIVIFLWLRRLAGGMAGALGVSLWALNPITLAYGHLVLTDMGETLMFVLAVWCLAMFLDGPSTGRAALCGLACGGALVMKFSAVVLAPILLVLVGLQAMRRREWRGLGKHVLVMALAAAGVVLLIYAPFWSPAPPLPADAATKIGVPRWFQVLRPVLIPPDFFKGLALVAGHEARGHPAFLCGQWRWTGWWYYFPVAMAVKTPLPLLLLTTVGLLIWLRGLRQFSLPHAIPWFAALIYLLFAMAGNINIGVRHLLPMFALLAVGTASQLSLRNRPVQMGAWLCAGWLLVSTWCAHPYFIEYFNELAGGPSNGYRWVVDSNLDWGQDVKRLKHFLDEQAITNINVAYLGPGRSIDYYGIASRRVTSAEAARMHSGTLVMSATKLVSPEWDWLRASHEPVARVGYTMFVYRLGDAEMRERWEQMVRTNPNDARAHYNLAIVTERSGDAGDAITHYEQAIRINPDFAMAHYNLAIALQRAGRGRDAIEHYEQVLRVEPDNAEAHNRLGLALERMGRLPEAARHYEQALGIDPDYLEAQNNLAWLLATRTPAQGADPAQSVALAEVACQLSYNRVATYLDTLAAAYAAAGRFDDAVTTAEKAAELARAGGQSGLAGRIEARLDLYRNAHAYRQPVGETEPHDP
jgi:tetratricopeptide (TPR) repeat protein